MNLLIRADANESIGSGHAMRCFALAMRAQRAGAQVGFVCTDLSAPMVDLLKGQDVRIQRIDARRGSGRDRALTTQVAVESGADWVVLDGYAFDEPFRCGLKDGLRDGGASLLVIDDRGAPFCCADRILNQQLYAGAKMYPEVEASRLLLGPRYLLLRPQFERWQGWSRPVNEEVRRLLVISGADPGREFCDVVATLADVVDPAVTVDVVGVDKDASIERSERAQRFEFHGHRDQVAQMMAQADMAVSTAGSLCGELLFMQLPALLMAVVDNQKPVVTAMAQSSGYVAIDDPGDASTISSLLALFDDQRLRRKAARQARQRVDGRGASRVYRILKDKMLRLRRCRPGDCRLLWKWANEPLVRQLAFEQEPIRWDDHRRWFEEKMADPMTHIFIGENRQGQPLGQVRLDVDRDLQAMISISVDPDFRSGGFGWLLMRRVLEEAPQEIEAFHAYVKPGNKPSLNLFESLQFRCLGAESYKQYRAVHFVTSGPGR